MRPYQRMCAVVLAMLLLSADALAAEPAEDLEPDALYDKCAPSVVMVTTVETIPYGFGRRTLRLLKPFPILEIPGNVISFATYPLLILVSGGPLKYGGSGVVIDEKGHFLTNHHVIKPGNVYWATMSDRRLIRAKFIGSDEHEDYALLKLELKEGEKVVPATLGDSSTLRAGDRVAAIGSPLRLHQTVSAGIVAGLDRRDLGGPFQDYIQTDLTIGQGSSGGPLFNGRGEVIGITTAMIGGAFQPAGGVTFSVPIDSVEEGLGQLKKHGKVTRGFLGVHIKDVTARAAKKFALEAKTGACIWEFSPPRAALFSPAANAGLEPGDVIVRYGALEIDRARTLARAVLTTEPGTTVTVTFVRGKTLHRRQVTIDRR